MNDAQIPLNSSVMQARANGSRLMKSRPILLPDHHYPGHADRFGMALIVSVRMNRIGIVGGPTS